MHFSAQRISEELREAIYPLPFLSTTEDDDARITHRDIAAASTRELHREWLRLVFRLVLEADNLSGPWRAWMPERLAILEATMIARGIPRGSLAPFLCQLPDDRCERAAAPAPVTHVPSRYSPRRKAPQ